MNTNQEDVKKILRIFNNVHVNKIKWYNSGQKKND